MIAGECPLYPRKRTSTDTTGMSALCQKRTFASQQLASLFDHFVSAQHGQSYHGRDVWRTAIGYPPGPLW